MGKKKNKEIVLEVVKLFPKIKIIIEDNKNT